jgi:hypothetical protein
VNRAPDVVAQRVQLGQDHLYLGLVDAVHDGRDGEDDLLVDAVAGLVLVLRGQGRAKRHRGQEKQQKDVVGHLSRENCTYIFLHKFTYLSVRNLNNQLEIQNLVAKLEPLNYFLSH